MTIDRRRFLASAAALSPLAACRSAYQDGLETLDPDASPQRLKAEYTVDPEVVYLNHGSIGTIPRRVQKARSRYLEICESNPWLYMWGGEWEEAREDTRRRAAEVLGCEPGGVAITHNTTEGFSVLANGLPLGAGDEVVFSSLNHAGASICWEHAASTRGYTVRRFDLPLDEIPQMTAEQVVALHAAALSDATRVLVIPHVDNIVGLRHPVAELAAMAKARGVEFVCVDGAQTVGMVPVDVSRDGVDVYCTSPHKWLQAPKGVGLMFLAPPVRDVLRAGWVTWGQQRWAGTVRVFEDYGTRNLPEVLALGDAIAFQQRLDIARSAERLAATRQRLREAVADHPDLRWRSPSSWAMGASLVALEVVGADSVEVGKRLWERHRVVVRAFGGELKTLRVSPNATATAADIDALLDGVRSAARSG